MQNTDLIILVVSLLLAISVFMSKLTSKIAIPSLLTFLILGMLAGSEGIGGIYFDDAALAQSFAVVALIFILFTGGLETRMDDVKPILGRGLILSTIGVLLTAVPLGLFAHWLLGIGVLEGLLLGSIVASTDAAAVFTVLRSKGVKLRGRLRPLLEFESGSNDPMAIFLTIGLIQLIQDPSDNPSDLALMFLKQMPLGAIVGYLIAKVFGYVINKINLDFEGLYPIMTASFALLAYGFSQFVGGNGFLTVYIFGMLLAQKRFVHKRSLLQFHDGLAWMMQVGMFLILGLLVFPSRLVPVMGIGILLSIFLIVVARPLGVFVSLMGSGFDFKERLLVSWVGLRGAVPIVLATYPLVAGLPSADIIFNIVFFIVLTSVAIQGPTIPWVARWLGVDDRRTNVRTQSAYDRLTSGDLKDELLEVEISESSPIVGKPVFDLGFPSGTLILMIDRGGKTIIPQGATKILAGDLILLMSNPDNLKLAQERVGGKHT